MKQHNLLGLAAIVASLALPLQAAEPTGYVDFGKFSAPKSGGEFVEVQLQSNLIAMVARLAAAQEPEVAELLGGLKRIRVNVIGVDDSNREQIRGRVKKISADLDEKGWERIVTVRSGEEDVNVYLKTRNQEAVEGLVVTVLEGKGEAVLINIVGDIRPEQIATLGERFDIEPLKKVGRSLEKS